LRHVLGHAVPLAMAIPLPEANRGQNAAQRAASGETYAKRYAMCSALGIHTGDDDDGNAGEGEPVQIVTPEQAEQLRTAIKAAGRSETKLCEWAGVESLAAMPFDKFASAMRMIGGTR